MAEFVWLRNGDTLPAVAVAQLLLKRTGHTIAADGAFGPVTRTQVRDFQRDRRLSVDGVIGRNTWGRLKNQERLPIIDCIDIFDPDLYTSERHFLTAVGGDPITLGGMCNGIEQAVSDIMTRSRSIFLLRFHGHGAPGAAGVSDGHGDIVDHSSFQLDRPTMTALGRLRTAFGPYGCIQFMHCQVGRSQAGARFLRAVADATGVPATAAIRDQYASTLRETVRYEGLTRTVCPGGRSLRAWARSLPEFVGMTVA